MSNQYTTRHVKPLLTKLRGMEATDLNQQLQPLRRAQFALRLQRASGQAVKPDQFGKVRKDIARVKTLQRALRAGGDKA